jgi:ferric-dicitrate binding protein FerR (iron transport regulator)
MNKPDLEMNELNNNSFEDLILDESFREYVEGSKEESVSYWNKWIQAHPERSEEIRKSRLVLITLMNTRKESVSPDKNKALDKLLTGIDKQPQSSTGTPYFSGTWVRLAAMLLLSAGLAWIWHALTVNHYVGQQKIVYNEIIVAVGEKSQIILSDGTHVWINSGSHFKYPVTFGQISRDVSLEGEAYFDVKKRGKAKFTVSTRDVRIEVLGTAFNVKAYPEDRKTQTTVVRGIVKVESKEKGIDPVLIRPNQMAVLKESEPSDISKIKPLKHLNVVDKVNTVVITSWKDQMLVFSDETFEDIAIKLERWFNMKIIIDDNKLKQERYTGKFVHNETVYEVLEAIKLTTPIEYTVKGAEIIIKRK